MLTLVKWGVGVNNGEIRKSGIVLRRISFLWIVFHRLKLLLHVFSPMNIEAIKH